MIDNEVNFPASKDVCLGQDMGLGILVVDNAGAPVNCSTFAMLFAVYDKNGTRVIAKDTTVGGEITTEDGAGVKDRVVPHLEDTDTVSALGVALISAGSHAYELWRTDEGNEVRLARGYIDFQDSRRRQEVV